jgi:hypothetical protein
MGDCVGVDSPRSTCAPDSNVSVMGYNACYVEGSCRPRVMRSMQPCPNCAKENPPGEAYCYACGHILPSALAAMGISLSTVKLEEEFGPAPAPVAAYFHG